MTQPPPRWEGLRWSSVTFEMNLTNPETVDRNSIDELNRDSRAAWAANADIWDERMAVGNDWHLLLVRPGMTGLWQVSGRSTLTWDETLRLDLRYIDNWTFATDLRMLSIVTYTS